MSRTNSLVHDPHSRSTPLADVDNDQPDGSPSPPESSSLDAPQRLQVLATVGTVPVPG
jgi:hypothetical protein